MNAETIRTALLSLPALLIAVVVHEYCHGRAAELMGDPTARNAGRLTLNPIPHLDPFGSILLPLLLLVSGSPVLFAAAKPVPINPMFFRDKRRGLFWVGLAGPASNLAMGAIGGILVAATFSWAPVLLIEILYRFVFINCLLAVFNLIPLPPLDGSRLAEAVMPQKWIPGYSAIEPFGIFIIFGMFFLVPGFFSSTVLPAASFLATVFSAWPQMLAAALGF